MLTDAKVRTAKPRPKAYKIADANRLFLMVTPSGGKLWRWNYECDGKNKTMALGAYPLVSLAEARGKRDEAYTILCKGHDPVVAKKLKKEANLEAGRQTFERVAREWYGNTKAQWATIHASDVIRSLERDVFPAIGDLPIAQLTPPLILGVLREIETRGAIETAKRVRQRISAVFVYAIARGSRRAILRKSWARCSSRCARADSRRSPTSCRCARCRAAFSTIMNEWAERHGDQHDRQVIDLMLAHVPKDKVESAYNRAAYMRRRRELAMIWADMLSEGLPNPLVLVDRPVKDIGSRSRRSLPAPVEAEFRFPVRRRVA